MSLDLDELERISQGWGPLGYQFATASQEDLADARLAMEALPALVRIAQLTRSHMEGPSLTRNEWIELGRLVR